MIVYQSTKDGFQNDVLTNTTKVIFQYQLTHKYTFALLFKAKTKPVIFLSIFKNLSYLPADLNPVVFRDGQIT
jgi:hypothetical protein